MRKLLIKLVAIETALVGWLSYWLFLVYVNNPPVAAELSSSLQRFPQLSFSTVDIAVMVIIAALAVTLAFRFQRGLRPGIRLERALQMLENLMKRNLVLEAQVAELKIEKSHTPPLVASSQTPPPAVPEPQPGSWEKAFRTPLEAGPPMSAKAATATDSTPFGHETGIPPPRIEPTPPKASSIIKTPILISDKGTGISPPSTILVDKPIDKTSYPNPPKPPPSMWEDSPQLISESRGILTPSASTRKVPTVSDSGGLKQPYIPAPAPKMPPPSVIVGPMTSPSPLRITPSPAPKILARPTNRTTPLRTPPSSASPLQERIDPPKLEDVLPTAVPPPLTEVATKPSEAVETATVTGIMPELPPKPREVDDAPNEKTSSKPVQPTRKKPPPPDADTPQP